MLILSDVVLFQRCFLESFTMGFGSYKIVLRQDFPHKGRVSGMFIAQRKISGFLKANWILRPFLLAHQVCNGVGCSLKAKCLGAGLTTSAIRPTRLGQGALVAINQLGEKLLGRNCCKAFCSYLREVWREGHTAFFPSWPKLCCVTLPRFVFPGIRCFLGWKGSPPPVTNNWPRKCHMGHTLTLACSGQLLCQL